MLMRQSFDYSFIYAIIQIKWVIYYIDLKICFEYQHKGMSSHTAFNKFIAVPSADCTILLYDNKVFKTF